MIKVLKQTFAEIYKILYSPLIYISIALIILSCIPLVICTKEEKIVQNTKYEREDKIYEYNQKVSSVIDRKDAKANIIKEICNFKIKQIKEQKTIINDKNKYLEHVIEKIEQIEDTQFFIYLINSGYRENELNEVNETHKLLNIDNNLSTNFKDLKKYSKELDRDKRNLKNIIKNEDYKKYLKLEIEELSKEIENYKNSINKINNNLKIDKEKNINEINKAIEINTYKIQNYNFQINNNIKFDLENARYINVSNLPLLYEQIILFKIPSEKEYLNMNLNITYNLFKLEKEEELKKLKEKLKIEEYRAEKNVYSKLGNIINKEERIKELLFLLPTFFSIIFAATIFSKEHINGVEKMQYTRPIKREKILISKLIALSLVVIILNLVTYSVVIGCMYYENDNIFNAFEIKIFNDKIISYNYMKDFITESFRLSLKGFLFVVMIFSFSVIFRGESEPLLIGILSLFIGYIIKMFINKSVINVILNYNLFIKIYNKTILPYLINPNIDEIYNKYFSLGFNMEYGSKLIVIVTIFIFVIAIIYNKNKDVTNR